MFPLAMTLSTLSLLLLAAHFLRRGDLLTCLTILAGAGLLLFMRKRWVLRLVQAALVLATIVWAMTMNSLVRARLAEGGSAGRLAGILTAVIAANVGAVVLLGTRPVLDRYPAPSGPGPAPE